MNDPAIPPGQGIPAPDGTTPTTETFVVMSHQHWGRGTTLPEAKKNFKDQGGRLSDGHVVLTFDVDTEFTGIDGMGRVHYRWRDGRNELPNPPASKEFKPRRQS